MLRVPAREIATDHLLQLANVVREEGLEELATPGQGQLATGVRLTRRLLLRQFLLFLFGEWEVLLPSPGNFA